MPKTIKTKGDIIMSTRKTTAEKIAEQQTKMGQMQADMKRLLQQQKKEERKKRDHRIYKRGGLIESLLPDTIGLSDERFSDFIKRTTANDYGRKALVEFVAAQEKEDGEPAAVATVQDDITTPKTAAPKRNSGESGAEIPAQTVDAHNGTDESRTGATAGTGG